MIKTPLSTVIGGAFWTPSCTVIGGAKLSFETVMEKLFSNNEQGFFYDPSDLSTMYQDAAGTTAVNASGQPVGLILDKRKGNATGINLHTTATPMNTTTYPATGTRSGLDITVSQKVSGHASVSLGMPTVVGKTYLLELIAPNVSGFWVLVSNDSSSDNVNRRTAISAAPISKINTKITLVFTATAPVSYIHLSRGTSVTPSTFKDVSVREVLGNHSYQTTSAARPILRDAPRRIDFDTVDDKLITKLPAQLTGCTVIRSVPNVGTQILTGQTIPATYADNKDHCGLIVINRALTPSETSAITDEFNKMAGV